MYEIIQLYEQKETIIKIIVVNVFNIIFVNV